MASSEERKGTIIVTGANGGLGSAIVTKILSERELAATHSGLYTVRKAANASALKTVLNGAPQSHKHEILEMDLGSIASVRDTAAKLNRRVAAGDLPPIRALILNAAYQDSEEIKMSDDGYEMTWQVNYLANQLLVLMLLQSMDATHGRIVVIGSWSHDIDDKRNTNGGEPYKGWDSLYPGAEELAKGGWSKPDSGGGWYTGYRRYGASKLCAVMLMHELAVRLGQDPDLSNIAVFGLDPGAMSSDITRRRGLGMKVIIKGLMPVLAPIMVYANPNGTFRTTRKSAQDVHRLCWEVTPPPKGKLLYANGTDELETSREARDEEKRKDLWKYGLEAIQLKHEGTVLKNWQ
ncbi:unnamed protein product [Clonostachys rosea]|uniref:Ketoreductase (KR) domain-containing protein n=1 Tax=Bionectria ochroleuca TaxID=29856 RepID=A0ABY6U8M2_BIOOC|nr:unnamed protein product [Clonostachys rosea]